MGTGEKPRGGGKAGTAANESGLLWFLSRSVPASRGLSSSSSKLSLAREESDSFRRFERWGFHLKKLRRKEAPAPFSPVPVQKKLLGWDEGEAGKAGDQLFTLIVF